MSIVKTWSNIRTTLTQAQINSHSIPRLDPIDSKFSLLIPVAHYPESYVVSSTSKLRSRYSEALGRYNLVATRHHHLNTLIYKHETADLYMLNRTYDIGPSNPSGWVVGHEEILLSSTTNTRHTSNMTVPQAGWHFAVKTKNGIKMNEDPRIQVYPVEGKN